MTHINISKPVILAVDDQPVILHMATSILKNDYKIKPFTSGKSVLKYLETQTADLILLDCEMPEMNGFEVLEKIRGCDKTSGIPVIFLTGSDEDSRINEAMTRGASDYITKPLNAQDLLNRISKQLRTDVD